MKSHQFIVVVLVFAFALVSTGYGQQTAEQLYQSALYKEEIEGELDAAIKIYETIIKQYPENRPVSAKSLLHTGICKERLGMKEAQKAYERIVKDYTDQSDIVSQAKVRLAVLGSPGEKKGFLTRRILADASGVSGVLTADGKYIIGLNLEKGDVSRFEIASGQTSKITNKGPWGETDMSFLGQVLSHDGKRIIYDSFTKDWISQVVIRNLDGSEVRTIYSEKDYYSLPYDLSPDEKFILALRSKNGLTINNLTLISTTDGSVRELRYIPSSFFMFENAKFSPDGQFIAFSFVRDGNPPHGDIFLISSDGQNEIVVAGHQAEDRLLGWTANGKNLLFLSDRSGTWDIWTVSITKGRQQGEPELLKKDFGYYSEVLGISPDGSFYYKVNTPSGGLYSGTIDLETGKILVVPSLVTTRYTGAPYNLTWSPDGKYLLYLSRRGSIGPGSNLLTIRSDATGEERFLSPGLRFVNQMSWSPDSRSIFAIGITEKESGIYQIDAETSATIRLKGLNGYAPSLCPDGKTLVFVKAGPILMKHNLDTGEESEIAKITSLAYDLSPDGQKAVFFKDSIIKTVPLSGGEPKALSNGLAEYYRFKWTKDDRYIIALAVPNTNSENSKIWRISAQGGTPLKLDLSVPNLMFFALHPDNSRFMMSLIGETKSELWVMENFLPK